MKTQSIGERIQKIVWEKFQNDRKKFCFVTGIPKGTLGAVILNYKNPGIKFFNKLLQCNPDLSVTWVITGYGEMFIPNVMDYRLKIEQLETLNEFLRKNRF